MYKTFRRITQTNVGINSVVLYFFVLFVCLFFFFFWVLGHSIFGLVTGIEP